MSSVYRSCVRLFTLRIDPTWKRPGSTFSDRASLSSAILLGTGIMGSLCTDETLNPSCLNLFIAFKSIDGRLNFGLSGTSISGWWWGRCFCRPLPRITMPKSKWEKNLKNWWEFLLNFVCYLFTFIMQNRESPLPPPPPSPAHFSRGKHCFKTNQAIEYKSVASNLPSCQGC